MCVDPHVRTTRLLVMDKIQQNAGASFAGVESGGAHMLTNLHVKNLALISELEVEFSPGLNILTGETGAGKSILIGSINLALGPEAG